jgi:serine/threonine protein kinase
MAQPLLGFLAFALGTVVVLTVPVLVIWSLVQVLRGLGFAVGGVFRLTSKLIHHVATFVFSEIRDCVQFGGSVLTLCLVTPLCIASFALLRGRAGKHYAGAVEDEFTGALTSLYRIGLGNPVRLLGLGGLTDGIERRFPDVVSQVPRTGRFGGSAPASAKMPKDAAPSFDGYVVQSELQAGGSGARLFCAVPTAARAKEMERRGLSVPQRVVIKAFDLGYGSTIPQIVRESRSLEAAKNLGLILEHELGEGSFHYVMPFVPGEDLDQVTRRMHAMGGRDGLDDKDFSMVIAYARDLCDQLGRFHTEGLWHKDIKPSNLLVADGRLQVVDFGLVTPLESALTLTTHGTEFFRDPELVRLALAGKRVKDVDGVKFDLYSAGAVLYSMVENSFPAHGSLSSISKRTPEALRWIVRRAMADVDKRYASAADMARDIDVLVLAQDPFTVKPAHLPSVSGREARAPQADPKAGPRAQRAAFAGAFESAMPGDQPEDVQRINAFGMTAEIRGLGRAKEGLKQAAKNHSRDARRARRTAAKAEQRAHAEAVREAKNAAKLDQRHRRRGMLKSLATLAIIASMMGGVAAVLEAEQHGPRHPMPPTVNEPQGRDLFGDALDFLGENETESRYLEAAEFSLGRKRSSQGAERRLHPATERELQSLGSMPRVLIFTDASDRFLTGSVRAASRRLRALGAIPIGVDREGRPVKGDSYAHLLNAAQQQTDLAKGSIEESEARLARLAARHSDIDAIYWLRRQPNTGFLHTTFASSSEAADWGWEEGSENCSDESSSCDSGDETNDCGGTCATASSCVTQ